MLVMDEKVAGEVGRCDHGWWTHERTEVSFIYFRIRLRYNNNTRHNGFSIRTQPCKRRTYHNNKNK